MKILYIAPSIPVPGFHGGSTHVSELSKHLTKLRCEVIVISRRLPGQKFFQKHDGIYIYRVWRGVFKPLPNDYSISFRDVNTLINSGNKLLEKVYFNSFYLFYVTFIGVYLAKKYNIDVILERGDSYGIGALISMFVNKPLIVEVRDVYQPTISLIRASLILTYDKSIIRKPLYRNKAVCMYGGVDIHKFQPIKDSKASLFPHLKDKIVIGYSGSFMRSHNINEILKIAKRLYEKYGEIIHFLMIGPYDQDILKKTNHLNLTKIFTFVGVIEHDKLPIYLSSMDIGIALYDPEKVAGPPYKVYEYMACGIPSVTTDTIFSRKIIKNGLAGFLVKAGDLDDLFKKLCLLIEDKELRCAMGSEARNFVKRFSWSNEAERIFMYLKYVLKIKD